MGFFASLSVFEIVLFSIAAAATIILIIQIILILVGFEHGVGDFSADTDTDLDAGSGAALFTVKGAVAFFSIGGWVGLALSLSDVPLAFVIIGAFVAGAAALVGVGYLFKLAMKLQSNGILVFKDAVGKEALVYLTIPKKGGGQGKINLTAQERFIEAEAMTEEPEPIPTGTLVKIVGYLGNIFIVERIVSNIER
jgi:hypothetical protein